MDIALKFENRQEKLPTYSSVFSSQLWVCLQKDLCEFGRALPM